MRILAAALVRLAQLILPRDLRDWAMAMQNEVSAIESPGAAIRYAFGCLSCSFREFLAALACGWPAALCGSLAVLLGCLHLKLAGAPARYIMINLAALVIGWLGLGVVRNLPPPRRHPEGVIALALGLFILGTALFGVEAEGVRRWLDIGSLLIQPSLIAVPIIVTIAARRDGNLMVVAIGLAAAAIAIQPDRAMAGALFAGTAAIAYLDPTRSRVLALIASGYALVITIARPDFSPAVPYVDQILLSTFDSSPFAACAIWLGCAAMLFPAVAGWFTEPERRTSHAVFSACWGAMLVAALVANFPTPLVGYGGSAIIGYFLSLAHFGKMGREPANRAFGKVVKSGSEKSRWLNYAARQQG